MQKRKNRVYLARNEAEKAHTEMKIAILVAVCGLFIFSILQLVCVGASANSFYVSKTIFDIFAVGNYKVILLFSYYKIG